jgi:hypothetical protein
LAPLISQYTVYLYIREHGTRNQPDGPIILSAKGRKTITAVIATGLQATINREREVGLVLKELDRNELVRWGPKQVVIIAECEPDTLSNNPVDYDPSKLAIPTGEFGFTSEFTRYDDPLTGTPAEIPVPAATGHGPPANSAAPPAPRPSPPPTPPAPGPPLSPPPTAPATAADLDPSTPASRRTRERLLERERAALTRENGELETEIRRLRTANSELRRDLATTETTIAGFGDVEAKLHAQIAALQEKVASPKTTRTGTRFRRPRPRPSERTPEPRKPSIKPPPPAPSSSASNRSWRRPWPLRQTNGSRTELLCWKPKTTTWRPDSSAPNAS